MMNKHRVDVLDPRTSLEAADGAVLSAVLRDAGIPLSLYCGGSGVCGKCLVEVIRGELPPPSRREIELLARHHRGGRFRLACSTRVRGGLTLRIPPSSLLREVPVLDSGLRIPLRPDPSVRKLAFDAPAPALSDPLPVMGAIEAGIGRTLRFTAGTSARAVEALAGGRRRITAALGDDDELLDVETGDATGRCFGVAVDIGTSTVVAELVDLGTGRDLGRVAAMNVQVPYGADVVSRIAFAEAAGENLGMLAEVIRRQLDGMIGRLAADRGIDRRHIYEIVAAGNSAMNHILLGVPVGTLARAPYHAAFSRAPVVRAAELGLGANPSCRVIVVPNIRSFVGGDIAAGLSALDLETRSGRTLFLDLGTNGEIVLKEGARVTATSTAAGPAFEGMSLSCGMLAQPGAVASARWAGGLTVGTIGGAPASGVCGTGLVDILAVGIRHGLVSPDGRILSPTRKVRVADGVVLTQPDVRKLQLAVAAIRTGVRLMLDGSGLGSADLDGIFVAGAFGAALNVRNAMAIGLLPTTPVSRVAFVGNSSLAGARKLLLSREARRRTEAFVRKVRHVSLAASPDFQKEFIGALRFGPYM